ncbi:MAG: 50S ribosomal protein L32 [Pseudomonadota bacterium]|nr:50S ribosomal protein L32 [Pseudomonadota bacterium]
MAVPKVRTSKSRRNTRRSHHALTAASPITCSNCGNRVLPGHVCLSCGYYKGKQVFEPKIKAADDEFSTTS